MVCWIRSLKADYAPTSETVETEKEIVAKQRLSVPERIRRRFGTFSNLIAEIHRRKEAVRFHLRQGHDDSAFQHARRLAQFQNEFSSPEDAAKSLSDLGSDAKSHGSLRIAEKLLRFAVEMYDGDQRAWAQLADVLRLRGVATDALIAYDKAIANGRDDFHALCCRAEVLRQLNRPTAALAAYDEIIARYPDEVIAKNGKAEVLRDLNRSDDALRVYEETIANYPSDVVAKCAKAETLRDLNRPFDALAAYDRIIAEHPETPIPKNGRAETLRELGRLEETLAAYEETIKAHPDDPVAKSAKAEVLLQLGYPKEALNSYDDAVANHPKHVIAQTGRINALRRLGRQNEALYALDQIIRNYPDNVVAQTARAEVLKDLDRPLEALNAYDQILQEYPSQIIARHGRIAMLVKLRRFKEAMSELSLQAPRSREDWKLFSLKGLVYLKMKNWTQAKRIFAEGVEANLPPREAAYYFAGLAICNLRSRKWNDTVSVLDNVKTSFLAPAAAVIRAHAFGASKKSDLCRFELLSIASSPSVEVTDVANEIDLRFLQRSPKFSEEWLFDHEEDLLLAA